RNWAKARLLLHALRLNQPSLKLAAAKSTCRGNTVAIMPVTPIGSAHFSRLAKLKSGHFARSSKGLTKDEGSHPGWRSRHADQRRNLGTPETHGRDRWHADALAHPQDLFALRRR